MKRELKAKWLAALRSGEYKQGKSALKDGFGDENKYCCLGVLCEVAGVPYDKTHRAFAFDSEYGGVVYRTGYPDGGWSFANGLGNAFAHDCANMNDEQGLTFNEIADFIEKELPDED
jgi:hypothetical protein